MLEFFQIIMTSIFNLKEPSTILDELFATALKLISKLSIQDPFNATENLFLYSKSIYRMNCKTFSCNFKRHFNAIWAW